MSRYQTQIDAINAQLENPTAREGVPMDADGQHDRLVWLILDQRSDYVRTAKKIREYAEQMVYDMERVIEKASSVERFGSTSINSLGVVQSSGARLDMACAELASLRERIVQLEGALGLDSAALNEAFAASIDADAS